MNKLIILIVACIALAIGGYSYMFYCLDKEQDMYKSKLGAVVIIGKDTSIIIDYSIINETFVTSSGKTVGSEFVFKGK